MVVEIFPASIVKEWVGEVWLFADAVGLIFEVTEDVAVVQTGWKSATGGTL